MKPTHVLTLMAIAALTSITTQKFFPSSTGAVLSATGQSRAAESALTRIEKNHVLRCAYINYPPYFEMDTNTHVPHGIMVDLMDMVGRKMNVTVAWTEEVGWGSMIEGLKSNRYDAVCSGVFQNTARAWHTDFSVPFGYARLDAWVRADDTRFSSDITRINRTDARISTIDGEMAEMLARDIFPRAPRVSLPQNAPFSDVLIQVTSGKADVALIEPSIAKDFLKTHLNALKNTTAEQPLALYPITLMLPKGDTAFKTVIDSALNEVIYTRGLDVIFEKNHVDADVFVKPSFLGQK